MSHSDNKVSLAELLAELKATVAATALESEGQQAADTEVNVDDMNLDFSDLNNNNE